jgi:hypothetical protein
MVKLSKTHYTQQPGKKKVGPISFIIIVFFESTNPYKNGDEAQQRFLEDLVFYICKGYR